MLVRASSLSIAHETAGAARTRHSLRPLFWADGSCKARAPRAAGTCSRGLSQTDQPLRRFCDAANASEQIPGTNAKSNRRRRGKLSTHGRGEKGLIRLITHARRPIAIPVLLSHLFKGALVSHKFFPSILLACVLFAPPAFAQTGDASRNAAATAVNNADGLTPDQAKRALDTLSDDKMRARMIETLRAIATASPQASAAPESQSAIPLTADSLGVRSCC